MKGYKNVNKININDNSINIKLLNQLQQSLKVIETSNLNKNQDNEIFIKIDSNYFFPIIIDIESIDSNKIFLIGFYFPLINTYYSIQITHDSDKEYVSWVQNNINEFFNSFIEYTNVIFKGNININTIFLLCGHNIKEYDLFVLLFFLNFYDHERDGISEVLSFSNSLIESKTIKRTNLYKDLYNIIWWWSKRIVFFDTIMCVTKSEAKSLFKHKCELFFKNKSYSIPPLEYDFSKKLVKSNTNNYDALLEYNYNDLFFTLLLFFEKDCQTKLQSRYLLYKNFNIKARNFSESLLLTDSTMNTQYICEKANINRKIFDPYNHKAFLKFSQIQILYDYKYLEKYQKVFGDSNLHSSETLKNSQITVKDCKLQISKGGLHNLQWNELASSKKGYSGYKMAYAETNENFTILMLDFQSFYVAIMLKLLPQMNFSNNEVEVLNELNQQRLKLKKQKNTNDKIFKLSTLAYSGSLNAPSSRVYAPNLYFSMTLNGQLILLELLNSLNDFIEKLIEANTDGVVLYIKKSNLDHVYKICDNFEKKYGFKIDTREVLKRGLFFSTNKKLLISADDKVTSRGFEKDFNYNIFENVLIGLLKQNNCIFSLIENGKLNKEIIFKKFYEQFNIVADKSIKNNNLSLFFHSITSQKKKNLVYLSKTPTDLGGMPKTNGVYDSPYPIKKNDFLNKINPNEFFEFLKKDLDLSSYFTLCLERYGKYFLYHINQDLSIHHPVSLNNYYYLISKNSNENYFNFYLKNKFILKKFKQLTDLGFFLYFKERDKKSFSKNKLPPNAFDLYNNSSYKSYLKFLFFKYTEASIKGVTLAVNLKNTWVNKIICLDFDKIEGLFLIQNFNEKNNINYKYFMEFILNIKSEGWLFFSSPTNTPFDRFKLFFKIKNLPSDFSYYEFKNLKIFKDNKFNFRLEEQSSIIGSNMKGLKIKNEYLFNKLPEVEFSYLENLLSENPEISEKERKMLSNIKYKNQLIHLFDERSNDERIIYNYYLLNKKNHKMNIFDSNFLHIDEKELENIFIYVVSKKNKNGLNVNNLEEIKKFYNYPQEITKILDNRKPTTLTSSRSFKKKLIQSNNQSFNPLPSNEFINICSNYNLNTLSLNDIQPDHRVHIINEIISIINQKYDINFIFESNEESQLKYSAKCIFKEHKNETTNKVALYVRHDLSCVITCFHQKCKDNNAYAFLNTIIEKNIFTLVTLFFNDGFQIKENTLIEIIGELE